MLEFSSLEDARRLLPEIVAHYDQEFGTHEDPGLAQSRPPIQIVYFGKKIPAPMEWLAINLRPHGIPLEVELVDSDLLMRDFDQLQSETETWILNHPARAQEGRSVMERLREARDRLRLAFGIEEGIGFWGVLKEAGKMLKDHQKQTSPGLQKLTMNLAAASGGVSAFSLAVSFSQKHVAQGFAGSAACVALGAWVYLNGYFQDPIYRIMARGKALVQKKDANGSHAKGQHGGKVYQVGDNSRYLYATNVLRSMASNAVIVGTAFGLDTALAPLALAVSIKNSAINSSARTWADAWIGSKKPAVTSSGEIQKSERQWSLRRWSVVNLVWNAAYGMIKNLDLLGLPVGSAIYYGLALSGPIIDGFRRGRWSSPKSAPELETSAKATTESFSLQNCSLMLLPRPRD